MITKVYTLRHDSCFCGREHTPTYRTGTINELLKAFNYSLEVARSNGFRCNYQPKTIKSLVNTLNSCYSFIHSCQYNTYESVTLVEDDNEK